MSEKPKVKIPSTYKVRSRSVYEVLQAHGFKSGKYVGECRADPRQIILEENVPENEKLSTFVHEMLHAITNEYENISLTEKEVRELEKALVYGFRRNREFWLELIKNI